MGRRTWISCAFSAIALLTSLDHRPAAASGLAGSDIIGVFSAPAYAGNVLNYPALGQTTFYNNVSTAPATTFINNNGSQLQWGTDPGSGIPSSQQFSQLTFSGSISPLNITSPFQIGTVNFLNGTSALNSLIFGATLQFYAGSVAPGNLIGTDSVIINTTSNQYSGTGLTQAQLMTDADYINICGPGSDICGKSISAYEDSEGGVGVLVALYGTISGDPQLTLTNVSLTPGQNPLTSGAIGAQPPLAATPLPSTWLMLFGGLVGLGFLAYRGSKHHFVVTLSA
jgi:hypothetical protein